MRIFVSPPNIQANEEDGGDRPTMAVGYSKDTMVMCKEVVINGPSRVVYNPKGRETIGARVYIETDAEVICKF